jgi:predicted nucleic-acid-binding Zn-ribbon protein
MTKEFFEIGKYEQIVKIERNKITDITCTCRWSSLYPNNYKEGKQICKHIIKLIKLLNKCKEVSRK